MFKHTANCCLNAQLKLIYFKELENEMWLFCPLTLNVNIKSFFRKLFITLQGNKHGVISKQMSKLFDLWSFKQKLVSSEVYPREKCCSVTGSKLLVKVQFIQLTHKHHANDILKIIKHLQLSARESLRIVNGGRQLLKNYNTPFKEEFDKENFFQSQLCKH